jgi:hypothetical protein
LSYRRVSTGFPRPVHHAASVSELSSSTIHGNYDFDEELYDRSASDWHMPFAAADAPLHYGSARSYEIINDGTRRNSTGAFGAPAQRAQRLSSTRVNLAQEHSTATQGLFRPHNIVPRQMDQPAGRPQQRPVPPVSSRSQFFYPSLDSQSQAMARNSNNSPVSEPLIRR